MPFESSIGRCAALITVAATLFLSASPAAASPWVLPWRTTVIGVTAGGAFATSEFLPDGTGQDFPLNGRFISYHLEASGRRGLGRGFEATLRVNLKGVNYRADPVILFDPAAPPATSDAYRDNVFSFSRQHFGLADIYLGVAHQHLEAPIRLASHLELKVPAGYDKPRGTFVDDTPSPDNMVDDVTLGDGQVDLEYSLQAGYFVGRTRTVLELDVGYRVRFGGPGHQVVGLAKVGQFITKYLLLYASVQAAFTLFEGDTIGKSFIAVNPGVDAKRFPLTNIKPIDLTLDRDLVSVAGGFIIRIRDREWLFRIAHIPWGQNISQVTSFSLGVLLPFR